MFLLYWPLVSKKDSSAFIIYNVHAILNDNNCKGSYRKVLITTSQLEIVQIWLYIVKSFSFRSILSSKIHYLKIICLENSS